MLVDTVSAFIGTPEPVDVEEAYYGQCVYVRLHPERDYPSIERWKETCRVVYE